jgi:hypothetical protein
LFAPERKVKFISEFAVKCHEFVIKSVEKVKYLGVTIDKVIRGDYIVDNIINKFNCRLKFLYRNRSWLNTRSRSMLSSDLIQCYFDYCSSWYSSITKASYKKLQVGKNKVVRYILDMKPRTRVSYEVLNLSNMLSVPDRVIQLRLNHVLIFLTAILLA